MNDLQLRPATDDDVEAMVDMSRRRISAITGRPHSMTVESMRSMRAAPGRDTENSFPVVTRDGVLVGYAVLFAVEPFSEIYVMAHAEPDLDDAAFAEVLATLVDAGERYAQANVAHLPVDAVSMLATDTLRDDVRMARVLTDLGFRVDRNAYEMAIDLTGRDLTPAPWPEGIEVRPLAGPEDADAVSAVFMEAFLDHQGDLPFTSDRIGHLLGGPDVRLDISALATDADGPVGAIFCRDHTDHGYVWVLGVLRRGRRRGLAQALLTHAFAGFAASGTTVVTLEVEAQSLTGATRVYERAGMSVRTVHDTWARPLVRT
jgi:mycothiol synthase